MRYLRNKSMDLRAKKVPKPRIEFTPIEGEIKHTLDYAKTLLYPPAPIGTILIASGAGLLVGMILAAFRVPK